jgi:hypothetical protein
LAVASQKVAGDGLPPGPTSFGVEAVAAPEPTPRRTAGRTSRTVSAPKKVVRVLISLSSSRRVVDLRITVTFSGVGE